MIKIALVSCDDCTNDVVNALKMYDLNFNIIDDISADYVISYGGDGTLLNAERDFPCISKIPIRYYKNLNKKERIDHIADLISKFINNKLNVSTIYKLKCVFNNLKLFSLNDILFANYIRNNAIRYKVYIDNKIYIDEEIGEGIVISTPHGSRSYFSSITNCIFEFGIGIAFNNSMKRTNHIILNEESIIKVDLIRGPAILTNDNSSSFYKLKSGDNIEIFKDKSFVKVYGLDEFYRK